jgi:hypothetical protein
MRSSIAIVNVISIGVGVGVVGVRLWTNVVLLCGWLVTWIRLCSERTGEHTIVCGH